mmetsp:Transcript_20029/g.53957  ORF Transcript_20029/g.53957 Transcript_20029/m.53957 type:complete len:236 (-) Transcript_20029:52-759(-)
MRCSVKALRGGVDHRPADRPHGLHPTEFSTLGYRYCVPVPFAFIASSSSSRRDEYCCEYWTSPICRAPPAFTSRALFLILSSFFRSASLTPLGCFASFASVAGSDRMRRMAFAAFSSSSASLSSTSIISCSTCMARISSAEACSAAATASLSTLSSVICNSDSMALSISWLATSLYSASMMGRSMVGNNFCRCAMGSSEAAAASGRAVGGGGAASPRSRRSPWAAMCAPPDGRAR